MNIGRQVFWRLPSGQRRANPRRPCGRSRVLAHIDALPVLLCPACIDRSPFCAKPAELITTAAPLNNAARCLASGWGVRHAEFNFVCVGEDTRMSWCRVGGCSSLAPVGTIIGARASAACPATDTVASPVRAFTGHTTAAASKVFLDLKDRGPVARGEIVSESRPITGLMARQLRWSSEGPRIFLTPRRACSWQSEQASLDEALPRATQAGSINVDGNPQAETRASSVERRSPCGVSARVGLSLPGLEE
jgi:hypothetical protein